MSYFQALLLSIIEGLTEFLPVSSTGHLIIASAMMGLEHDTFVTSFNIIIQFGAILSVLVLYWRRFLPNVEFYKKLIVAFLPAAVIGLLLKDHIDAVLHSVDIVAWALIIGGIILIWTDRKFVPKVPKNLDSLSLLDCLKLGLIQCLAFIPGVSRSGATILGGLYIGLSRKESAEFSFFLGVLTLSGASLIKSLKIFPTLEAHTWGILLFGILASFIFALIAIRFFLDLVSRYGFKHFGYYRIGLGVLILIMSWRGLL